MSEKLKAYDNYKKCCVPDCKNKNSVRHRFPLKNDVRFKIWIKCIQNPILTELSKIEVYNKYRICSQHFEKKYILAGSKLLHRQAIPTLNVTGYSGENINDPSPAHEIPGIPTEKIMVYMPSSEVKDTTKYAFTAQQLEELPVVDQAEEATLPATSFQRNICRTCLCKISASDSVGIFSDEQFYKGKALKQVFTEITHTLLDPAEKLPINICLRCADKLKRTVAFKRNIEKADLTLRRKLRLIEMKYPMKEIDSITSALDALCRELVQLQDEFETSTENHINDESTITSIETPKSNTPKRKPVDYNRLRAWQQDIDTIAARPNSLTPKGNNTIKITNETLNHVKEITLNKSTSKTINKPINNNSNYNKTTNMNLSNVSTTNNKNQNAEKPKVAIFSGKAFIKNRLNQCETAGISLDLPKTSKNSFESQAIKNRKENSQPKNLINITEMLDSEMADKIIIIQDTEDSNHMPKKLQLAQNEPVVIEILDDEEGMCSSQKKGHNVEKETHNVEGENNTEKENHNPEKTNCNVKKDSHLEKEYNRKMLAADSEKPHACYKCHKRFTSANILQRHLLYHSLKLEPTDQPEKQNENCGKSVKVFQIFKRHEQINNSFKKTNSDLEKEKVVELSDHTYDRRITLTHKQGEKEFPVCNSNESSFTTTCVDQKKQKFIDANDHDYNRPTPLLKRNLDAVKYMKKECKYCNKIMGQQLLRRHILQEHRELYYQDRKIFYRARYKCNICQKGHRTMRQLLSHMKSQHEAKYKCAHCDKTFHRKDPFIKHMKSQHEAKFKCAHGDKTFHRKDAFIKHLFKSHGIRRTSLCYICGKMISAAALSVHIKTHTIKSIKCTFRGCAAVLKYKSSLKDHIKRVHENEKSFICERCGKSFALKGGLRQHMRSHIEVLPYNCEICDKGFAVCSRLKRHLLSHQNSKPYTCPVCPQVFSRKYSIKKHCIRYHPEHPIAQNRPHYLEQYSSVVNSINKCFECTLCQRKFAYEYNLKKHNRTFHPVMYYTLKQAQLNNTATVEEIIHQERTYLNGLLN